MSYYQYLKVRLEDASQETVIEEMRKKISKEFGVTVVGQFVTVRWGDPMRSVTMVITDADDGIPYDDYEDK